nr:MAG TPA: Helicase REPLICATION [Caudoviricetes sp.]
MAASWPQRRRAVDRLEAGPPPFADPHQWWDAVASKMPEGYDFRMMHVLGTDPIPTGIEGFDAMLDGGLRPGMHVIGGMPGMFKTGSTVWMFEHMAEAGMRPIYVTLEMPRFDIEKRMCAAWASRHRGDGAEQFSWAAGRTRPFPELDHAHGAEAKRKAAERYIDECWATDPVLRAYEQMQLQLAGKYAIIEPDGGMCLSELLSYIAMAGTGQTSRCIFLDYLSLLNADTDEEEQQSEYVRVSRYTRSIAKMAQKAQVPIVVVAALKKVGQKEQEAGPSVDWFRGSSSVGYDSTSATIIMPRGSDSEAYDERHGIRRYTWKVVKDRNGRVGDVKISAQPWSGWLGNG